MTLVLNGTTGVSAVDGSASTPAIQGNDSNTGMFFPAADTIAFAEGGAEVARFNSSGNFGIGTSSPQAKLHAVAATTLTDDATYPIIAGDSSSTNRRLLLGYLGSGNGYGVIQSVSSGTAWTDTAINPNGGSLLVGTTSLTGGRINAVNGSGLWVQKLQDAASNGSMIQFITPGGAQAGSITISGSTTTYGSGSDYRLKENVQPMAGALTKVAALRPVTFLWKEDGSAGQGFIAHELQEHFPEAVQGIKDAVNEDGSIKPQGIDTSFLSATLAAAIQELHQIVQAQAAEIAELKANLP